MHRNAIRLLGLAGLSGLMLTCVAGCPLEPPSDAEMLAAPAPGMYYVQQEGDKLVSLQVSQARAGDARWTDLPADASWYRGPGLYELSEDLNWSLWQAGGPEVLDEFLQLYDPAPTPPEN